MLEERLFPAEVTGDLPRVTLVGTGRVQVEQHHGLSVYQPGMILFRASGCQVRITGQELRFRRYTQGEAVIEGSIEAVAVESQGKGGAQA